MNDTCNGCRFWKGRGYTTHRGRSIGDCRRRSPHELAPMIEKMQFPLAFYDEWCGEFEAAKSEKQHETFTESTEIIAQNYLDALHSSLACMHGVESKKYPGHIVINKSVSRHSPTKPHVFIVKCEYSPIKESPS